MHAPALAPLAAALAALLGVQARAQEPALPRTNAILVMSDDQGWGDTGYNGHPVLQTPTLDAMARGGVRFSRFYAGAPVCSPTRGSCLTGRHPSRYGIGFANDGHLPEPERTLAEILREHGYATGHFGKWHLGTLTTTEVDSNRGGRKKHATHYAPPWEHGFQVCFATEAKVPTFDPMTNPPKWAGGVAGEPGAPFGTAYWVGAGVKATDGLAGDDSRLIMDRVLPFLDRAVERGQPFFAVVWFHAPHLPVLAGPEDLARYADNENLSRSQRHYYACITALDAQLGRLRTRLRELGVAENTMLWFCSDNGPEGKAGAAPGSAGGLRGRKRSLLEGGIRVPGLLEWPAGVPEPRVVDAPCGTSDYLPTILGALELNDALEGRPLDGVDLRPLLAGDRTTRGDALCFRSRRRVALVEDRYKLVATDYSEDSEPTWQLYDLAADPAESDDIASDAPERVASMARALLAWLASCRRSASGADY